MINTRILFIIISIILIISSCTSNNGSEDSQIIARVYDSYLYYDDAVKYIPENNREIDSTQWINNYVDEWIKRQLVFRKAEIELNDKQKNVEKELMEYKTTLLIHRYRESLLKQQLDTIITPSDIEEYYTEFKDEFRLKANYVKTIYVKIPKSSPDFDKIRKWYKSNKEEDLNDLEDYCFQNGLDFNFDIKWEKFSTVLERVGYRPRSSNEDFLKRNHYIQRQDSVYRYFVNIKEYKLINDIAPLIIVNKDIKNIIFTKRKMKLLEQVENTIYHDINNKNLIEKYNFN